LIIKRTASKCQHNNDRIIVYESIKKGPSPFTITYGAHLEFSPVKFLLDKGFLD